MSSHSSPTWHHSPCCDSRPRSPYSLASWMLNLAVSCSGHHLPTRLRRWSAAILHLSRTLRLAGKIAAPTSPTPDTNFFKHFSPARGCSPSGPKPHATRAFFSPSAAGLINKACFLTCFFYLVYIFYSMCLLCTKTPRQIPCVWKPTWEWTRSWFCTECFLVQSLLCLWQNFMQDLIGFIERSPSTKI